MGHRCNRSTIFRTIAYFTSYALMILLSIGCITGSCLRVTRKASDPYGIKNGGYDSSTIYSVPLSTIDQVFDQNQELVIDSVSSKRFFLEVINGLVANQLSNHFKISPIASSVVERPLAAPPTSFSKLHRYRDFDSTTTRQSVQQLTQRAKVSLIAIVPKSSLSLTIIDPTRRWDHYYHRPVRNFSRKLIASAKIHFQMWNRNGDLVLENIATATVCREIHLSDSSKYVNKTDWSASLFGPPMVRAIELALIEAMRFNGEDRNDND